MKCDSSVPQEGKNCLQLRILGSQTALHNEVLQVRLVYHPEDSVACINSLT